MFVLLQVRRVLPQWLAQPDVIQRDMKKNLIPISQVPGICPILLKKLQANGIQSFFPGKRGIVLNVMQEDEQPNLDPY